MATALPANVNLIQLLAASPATTLTGVEPFETVQSGTSVAGTLNQILSFAQSNFSVGNLAVISGLSVLGVTGTASATAAAIAGVTSQVLAVNSAGTGLGFTGAPVLATSVTAPLFNASNTASGYQIGGTTIIHNTGNYLEVLTYAGVRAILFGSVSDTNNYYYGATHQFADRSQNFFATLNPGGSPILTIGSTTATGSGRVQLQGPLISGGTTSMGYLISTASSFGIFAGTGSPTITAGTSSLYFRNDGSSATTRIYVNKDGGSTWTAILASG